MHNSRIKRKPFRTPCLVFIVSIKLMQWINFHVDVVWIAVFLSGTQLNKCWCWITGQMFCETQRVWIKNDWDGDQSQGSLFKRISTNKAQECLSLSLKTCAEELTEICCLSDSPISEEKGIFQKNLFHIIDLTSIVLKCLEKLMVWKLKSNINGQLDKLTVLHLILQHGGNPKALYVDFSQLRQIHILLGGINLFLDQQDPDQTLSEAKVSRCSSGMWELSHFVCIIHERLYKKSFQHFDCDAFYFGTYRLTLEVETFVQWREDHHLIVNAKKNEIWSTEHLYLPGSFLTNTWLYILTVICRHQDPDCEDCGSYS